MKLEDFYVISINYKEFELEQREEFLKKDFRSILEQYLENSSIEGYVVIETCLRIEMYIDKNKNYKINNLYKKLELSKAHIKKGKEALEYLFNLVCGLESIIKGEDQILSQIRKAYLCHMKNKKTSKSLNNIFNKAIQAGKKFRAESLITTHNLSLDAIAVKFIRSKFNDLSDKKVFIIGVGELSSQILAILHKEKVKEIAVTNRSKHKTETIHQNYKDVKLLDYSEKYDQIKKCDIIISATSAPHFIVKEKEVKDVLEDGKNRFFLDLAVPRDIETEVGEYSGVNLFHLEDIWKMYQKNVQTREDVSKKYSYIIKEIMNKAVKWFEYAYRQ